MKLPPFRWTLILLTSFFWSLFCHAIFLNGAGATFPQPLYSKWFYEFYRLHPDTEINYQAIGSGGGIRQLFAETVDFGASDAPLSEKDYAKAPQEVIQFPTTIGSVVLCYHLKGLNGRLKLTPKLLSDLFFGKITKWNDYRLREVNPDLNLPDLPVVIVHRSDASGTTYVMSEYLSKISLAWKEEIGVSKAIRWPTGIGGKGNTGVTGLLKNTNGSLGYIEYNFAKRNALATALVQNAAGEFIDVSLESMSRAAETVLDNIPSDFKMSLTDVKGRGVYPITAFTYLLLYRTQPKDKGEKLLKFINWALEEGQKIGSEMDYAPLPEKLKTRIKEKLLTIQWQPNAPK